MIIVDEMFKKIIINSLVAVRKSNGGAALQQIKDERIKNKKMKIDIAK